MPLSLVASSKDKRCAPSDCNMLNAPFSVNWGSSYRDIGETREEPGAWQGGYDDAVLVPSPIDQDQSMNSTKNMNLTVLV